MAQGHNRPSRGERSSVQAQVAAWARCVCCGRGGHGPESESGPAAWAEIGILIAYIYIYIYIYFVVEIIQVYKEEYLKEVTT
jgi:hypothetical protein